MPDPTLPAWRAWLRWSLFFALVMAVGLVELAIGTYRRSPAPDPEEHDHV